MPCHRRKFIQSALVTGLVASCKPSALIESRSQAAGDGIPGPYPGRVVAVHHPGGWHSGTFQAEPVRAMIERGMMDLTGAESPEDAWRSFFEPGDVVGIKLNPVGLPFVISSAEVVQEIIRGLGMAGIPHRDIVAYDRYKTQFLEAGFDKWLPDGVRWTWATAEWEPLQLDMDGYDADQYIELPLVDPRANPNDPHHRRSYLARWLTKDVNKIINLSVLKHHQSAGITLALKNLSHGLVNNVWRSHTTPMLNTCGWFIPAIVDHSIIRQKVVLNILDGILGAYHGGPGNKIEKYVWPHQTMYFATDPVALDKTGWDVIDAKRVAMGMKPVGEAAPDEDSTFYRMQPEHVEISAAMGLGTFKEEEIDLRRVALV